MTSTAATESDPFTALRALLKSFDPHIKILSLAALFANPLGILPGITGLPLSLGTTPVLLGSVLLLGSLARPHSNDAKVGIKKHVQDDEAKPTEAVTDPLEGFIKTGLLGYIVFQLSQSYTVDFTIPMPPVIPPWAVWAFAATAAVAALFAPPTMLCGPIRFVCLEGCRRVSPSLAQFDWWLYPVIMLACGPALLRAVPEIGGPGGIGTAVIAGAYAYYAYNAHLRKIAEDVSRHVSTANFALASAREHAATSVRFEEILLKGAVRRSSFAYEEEPSGFPSASLETPSGSPEVPSGSHEAPSGSVNLVFMAAKEADGAARLAERAILAARYGDMEEARQQALATKAKGDRAFELMEAAREEVCRIKDLLRASQK